MYGRAPLIAGSAASSFEGEHVEDRADDADDALPGDDREQQAEAGDRDRRHGVDSDRGEGERERERVRGRDALAADVRERMESSGERAGDDPGDREHKQRDDDVGEEGERLRGEDLAAADRADETPLRGRRRGRATRPGRAPRRSDCGRRDRGRVPPTARGSPGRTDTDTGAALR
jgi:hypothetical protein